MSSLIVYGSLINNNEISKHQFNDVSLIPIKVRGYKRAFNQEPSWRQGKGKHIAVLNVMKVPNYWFNAILIGKIQDCLFTELDIRERGYNRYSVSSEAITAYDSKIRLSDHVYIYLGKSEKRNDSILPNPDYLGVCLDGAKQWGLEFYADFLETTYIQKEKLRSYFTSKDE